MTAIPHAALALTSALDRFGQANSRLLGAVTGADGADAASAIAEAGAAQAQFQAGVSVIRFSDKMWDALIEIAHAPPPR